jgi:hypothetical protein
MGLIETLKEVAEAVQKADNVDLTRQLFKAQQDAMELLDKNRALQERVREYEERERVRGELILRDDTYWLREGDKETAICLRCWDADRKRVTLLVGTHLYSCLNCGKRWARPSNPLPARPRVVRSSWMTRQAPW